jgi:hypothetical protein
MDIQELGANTRGIVITLESVLLFFTMTLWGYALWTWNRFIKRDDAWKADMDEWKIEIIQKLGGAVQRDECQDDMNRLRDHIEEQTSENVAVSGRVAKLEGRLEAKKI